ncbi:amino acid ABC transporter permease [Paraburkholderia susongensis]|uniref:Amino acid ABC transporter membrane protein 2, PAAT family n=1 Tax=Paraburkholderia susongensis TaxID=1515439 RepID=A0A1X7LK30_9BURK|nr:amino acid ABC transporter permease [Paraburkholderia susongensis]SMG53693.1 amino acid ABC transporter membrane protein 2, PAAT family [Paraburkholderia susongensis]
MWDLIHNYAVFFLIGQYPKGPLGGLSLTLLLALSALVLALPVGILFGLCVVSPYKFLRRPVAFLLAILRGTPLLMVIFWAYFLLPTLTGHDTGQFATMLVSLIIFDGAYLAEIFRAGIQALPRGQMEAARSLGFPYAHSMRFVILPQAMRNMLPSVVNQLVSTIKETSFGYIISLPEISFVTGQIGTEELSHAFGVYGILVFTYFVLCFGLSRFAYLLERHLGSRSSLRLKS